MAKNTEKINADITAKIQQLVCNISENAKADIYLIGGGLYKPVDENLINCVKANKQPDKTPHPNAFLLLTTLGGDPNVAYRIARCFQQSYKDGEFIIFVPSICKSAGTLVALGSTQLVMDDCSELGPLDVQLGKPDEIGEMISGLTPVKAIEFLQEHTLEYFEECFLNLIMRSNLQITTKTALATATQLASAMFEPVYAQLDPLKLGEYHRNMMIAAEYGRRLMPHGNLKSERVLKRLTHGYPSHGFVIDIEEAEQLFKKIRRPTNDETQLAKTLKETIAASLTREPIVSCIKADKPEAPQPEQAKEK